MFVKVTRSKNADYVQIVESYRLHQATKHRILLNLGRLDEIRDNPSLQRLSLRLAELTRAKQLFNPLHITEGRLFYWGYIAYRKLWNDFALPEVLRGILTRRKIRFRFEDACFLMAVQHLLHPRSKLGTFQNQQQYAQLPELDLNHLYRALDILCEEKTRLEETLFQKNRSLFNMRVDVVFYDVTTFSFQSVKADTLRDFGYSKDGKFNEVQVVLGLLLDCDGRPIGYELFPGNTFDGNTLAAVLESMEKRFAIRRVVIVADRGLNSKINLKRILDKGYGYIVSSRLRKLPKAVRETVLEAQGFAPLDGSEEEVTCKTLPYRNGYRDAEGKGQELQETLVVTYSKKRAEKDRADRLRLVEKAKRLLEDGSQISAAFKRGGRKYLKRKTTGKTEWLLDEETMAADERWDGYYAIQTSEKMEPREILEAYHGLWKIEESFRIMKSNLEVRPIFHWTEPRIKGHFVVCFLAFLMERSLEFRLRKAGEVAAPEQIRDALNSLCFVEVEIEGVRYYIKTKSKDLGKTILRTLHIPPPRNVTPVDELKLI
jgi:transposase